MKPAKFALEHLYYPEISVKASQTYEADATDVLTEPTIKIFINKTDDSIFNLAIRLNLAAEVPSDKYVIDAFAVGVFRADRKLTESQQIFEVAHSGPNLVFGGLRDLIATITGRGPWNEYYLQPQMIEPEDFINGGEFDLDLE